MIDTTKLESPVLIKEEIISDDDWKFNALENLPGIMKRSENSTVEIKLLPDKSESSKTSKSKKKRKHHSRLEIVEKVKRNVDNDDDENCTQDIIESSQPPVSCKKRRRSSNQNSDINIVRSLDTERIESASCTETESKEFLPNPLAACGESREKNLEDRFAKKLREKRERKKRLTINIDTESDSNHECNLRENENPNYQSHVETNNTNLVERKKKAKSKTKRNNSWDDSFTDFFCPVNKRHDDNDAKALDDSPEYQEMIESIKSTENKTPSYNALDILFKDVKTEAEVSRKDKKRKRKEEVERKEANTLLAMINNDNTSNSDSDHEVKKRIIDSSKESLNQGKLRRRSKSEAGKVSSISDDEDENQFSLSKSDETLDDYRSERHKSDKKRSKHNVESFELGRTIKCEESSDDGASNCGSTNISVKNSTTETKALKRERKREAKVKTEKKESNTLLAMMNDSSNSSDSNHESKSVDNSNENSLDERKRKKTRKSKFTKMLLTSDEEEEINSSEKKAAGDENLVSSSKFKKSLDNYRSKIDESDEKNSGDNSEAPEFREKKKTNKSSINAASNYESADDIKTEPEVLRKKRKHKAKHKVKNQESNKLLAMMNDSKNDSDSDDEKKNIDHTFKVSPNERSLKGISISRISESFSDTDKEEEKNPSSNTSSAKALLGKIRKFDLEEEAKDLEEMIIAMEEEEQVPKETIRKLRRLQVQLRHTVPPQHQVETCAGSRGPTPKQKEMIEKFGPIKCGKFTPEEDDIIVRNWKSFCKMHNWDSRDVKPFLYMRHREMGFMTKFTERQKFVQFLADGLPWRTLYSVYWRFRNLYQPHIQTRYTEEEDKVIIAHMENNSAVDSKNVRKFSELAKILNRTRASVWRRYRLLKRKRESYEKIKWDLHLLRKMIINLMKYTLCDDVSQLKDLEIPFAVWKKLSEKFEISSRDLKEFWLTKLHIQLFSPEPVYMNDVKIKLIEYFYITGITEWWEIEWPNITKHFDGMTSTFLAQIFNNMVHDEKLEGTELTEILEHLYEVKKPQLQNAPKDKCLPRIIFANGNVKVLDTTGSDRSKKKKSTKRSLTQDADDERQEK